MFKSNGKRNSARLVLSVIILTMLAACSSPQERKIANRDFDYVDARLVDRAFVIPTGLTAPVFNSKFDIPALPQASLQGPVGDKMDVRPPAQLFNIVEGSQGLQNGAEPTVVFYSQRADQNLKQDLNAALLSFLSQHHVQVQQQDQSVGVVETSWFENVQALGNAEADDEVQVRQRYRFTLTEDATRRAVTMAARVVAHEETVDGDSSSELSSTEAQRSAAQILNQFSLYVDHRLKSAQPAAKTEQLGMTLGQDNNDLTAIIVDSSFDNVWRKLNQTLPKYGFAIGDAQQSLGWIDAQFAEQSDEFWQQKGMAPIKLEAQSYRLQLGEMDGGKTSITLFNKDKKPLASEQTHAMYQGLTEILNRSPVGHTE